VHFGTEHRAHNAGTIYQPSRRRI